MPETTAQPTIRRRDDAPGRASSVALVVMDVNNPFYAGVVRGAEDAASDTGHALFLGNSDDSDDKEIRYLEMLDRHDVAGIVLSPRKDDLGYLDLVRDRGIEVVVIERKGGEGHCSVSVDDEKGGAYAVRHLASLGHRKIAVVLGPPTGASTARWNGAASVAPDDLVEVRVRGYDLEAGAAAAEAVAASGATAAFCVNDLLAIGLMRGMHELGRSVPDDLAVVGYDDIPLAALLPVPLTTVSQPMYGLGHTAMRLLVDEVENPDMHAHQAKVFTPSLIVRESCGAPPAPA